MNLNGRVGRCAFFIGPMCVDEVFVDEADKDGARNKRTIRTMISFVMNGETRMKH
jgi:hypothetical protein